MSQQMSLLQLRNRVKAACDMSGSTTSDNFIPDDEWTQMINASLGEFNELLVRLDVKTYLTSSIFTVSAGQATQPLPSQVSDHSGNGASSCPVDFLAAKGLDRSLDNSGKPGTWANCCRLSDWNARNAGNNSFYLAMPLTLARYEIVGSNIQFFPPQLAPAMYQLWWYPDAPTLVQDSDWIDNQRYWSQYIVADVAIKALTKEESDPSMWVMMKQQLLNRIESMGSDRDFATPSQAGRMDDQSWGGWGPGWGSGW